MSFMNSPSYVVFSSARRKNFLNKYEFALQYESDIITYCTNMAKAIDTELQQRGHCWLIDRALSEGSVFSLDWAVMQALADARKTGSQSKMAFPAAFQTIPVSDSMEAEMLALHQAALAATSKAGENRADAITAQINELNGRLEQALQTRSLLESQISQLRSDAAKLRLENQEAQDRVQKRLSDARYEAEAMLRAAREQAGSIRGALMRGVEQEIAREAGAAPTDEVPLRDVVGNETRRMETAIRTSMDAYRDEIYRMIYEFRTGLYRADFTALCLAYQKLYLFAMDIFDKRADGICGELGNMELAARAQESLRKLQGQLIRRVTTMEESFRKLGLNVFRPEPGDEYSDVYHVAENAEDDGYLEATVRRCVCPGIRTEEQVLCRAAVIVDPAARA